MSATSKLPILRFSTVSANDHDVHIFMCSRAPALRVTGHSIMYMGYYATLLVRVRRITYIIPKRPLCCRSQSTITRKFTGRGGIYSEPGVVVNDDFRVARGIAK